LDGQSSGCDLLAGGRLRLRISANHVAHGSFVVPSRGYCFQTNYTHRVTPGRYGVIFGCHVCNLTTFASREGEPCEGHRLAASLRQKREALRGESSSRDGEPSST
jgi:hypothetical protein